MARRASEFLEAADFHIAKRHFSLAAFSLEQALQLYLKSRLLRNGVDYPRTHSVLRLLELLGEVSGDSVEIL